LSGDSETDEGRIIVGRVKGTYGVQGWIRVQSFTRPEDNVLSFSQWSVRLNDGWRQMRVLAARRQGRSLVAHLHGCDDLDAAGNVLGAMIAVPRAELAPLQQGEYYWTDLVGMAVVTRTGAHLGTVERLLETGANDVLVVRGERERLIPFIGRDVIEHVDLDRRCISVDWERDF
jgi:16S rRNA processing protein RimM